MTIGPITRAIAAAGALATAGCAATPTIFVAGHATIDRSELVARARAADVVLVGEIHDHPTGLAVAADLYDDLVASGARAPLSMEFLERDVQPAVDDWLADRIDEQTFKTRAGQKRAYDLGHGRMIARAKASGLPVVAANAPRAYAKKARIEGYDALRVLSEKERALFAIPDPLPGGAYRDAFATMMGGGDDAHGGHTTDIDAFFRAQALWDATMAESVMRAALAGRPVVHVVGRFHVENQGGMVQLVHRATPRLRTFVVAMVERADEATEGRADATIVVGEAPAQGE